ncbi:WAT1-related protein At5g64700-like isoform X2 [Phalaenopsis equestris]|uniref:WAT1-related protein At5g64700-like isoform X2 n=1 Tax=Phalaenopsis equestris TaxID=78828 RepID=UPI0009E3C6EA|nr:WAT1-related protein At5g64700-like isoform X2 [Phalaenopsis equestris]
MAAWKHYSAIIFVQLLMAVMNLLGKTAFNRGMSTFVFVFYRQVVATVFLTPLAIIFTRKTAPPTSFKMLVKIFMLSLLGFPINLNLQSVVVNYTSATVASAALNLMPVFTFLLTVLLRIETFRLKSMSGIAKLSGFVLCVTGVMLIALYKGPQLKILNFHQPFLQSSGNHNYSTESRLSWILGSFLVFVVAIFWALWTVLQGIIIKEYPSKLLLATLISLFSAFQCFLVAFIFESNFKKWKLRWDEGLLAVAYNGVFIAGLALYLQSWCNDKKGPFFVAAFSPLALVFTITIASVILGERTNLGR